MKLLKVKDIYETSLLQFVFKCINGKIIDPFKEYYHLRNEVHMHNTRSKSKINTAKYRTNLGKSTTHNTGATLWNNLDESITDIKSPGNFKRTIITKYINTYSSNTTTATH